MRACAAHESQDAELNGLSPLAFSGLFFMLFCFGLIVSISITEFLEVTCFLKAERLEIRRSQRLVAEDVVKNSPKIWVLYFSVSPRVRRSVTNRAIDLWRSGELCVSGRVLLITLLRHTCCDRLEVSEEDCASMAEELSHEVQVLMGAYPEKVGFGSRGYPEDPESIPEMDR